MDESDWFRNRRDSRALHTSIIKKSLIGYAYMIRPSIIMYFQLDKLNRISCGLTENGVRFGAASSHATYDYGKSDPLQVN